MTDPVLLVDRMQTLIAGWEQTGDRRAIFLSCYVQMTTNMFQATRQEEFHDPVWVNNLVHRFADYYFQALEAYDLGIKPTPRPWLLTFDAARNEQGHVLQHLLLGINAHINYDLCFAVEDALRSDWLTLDPVHRAQRYEDHCHVNRVIAQTIDAVQDSVVERYSPGMDYVDRLMGRLDEQIMTQMIRSWRGEVWGQAIQLVEANEHEKSRVSEGIENRAANRAQLILGPRLAWIIDDVF